MIPEGITGVNPIPGTFVEYAGVPAELESGRLGVV